LRLQPAFCVRFASAKSPQNRGAQGGNPEQATQPGGEGLVLDFTPFCAEGLELGLPALLRNLPPAIRSGSEGRTLASPARAAFRPTRPAGTSGAMALPLVEPWLYEGALRASCCSAPAKTQTPSHNACAAWPEVCARPLPPNSGQRPDRGYPSLESSGGAIPYPQLICQGALGYRISRCNGAGPTLGQHHLEPAMRALNQAEGLPLARPVPWAKPLALAPASRS